MTDFRALCAELHVAFTTYAVDECHHNLLERARAALADEATSVTENPTDEDLLNLHDWMTDEWAANHDFELPPSQYARAVLASWGNPAPQPVPVSEQLPGPKDCDEKGRCWWWQPSHPEGGYLEGWMLRPRFWGVGYYDLDDRLTHTHWLPAHAIQIPTAND